MTTTITVQSHNHPARVRVLDQDPPGQNDEFRVADERILRPADGVQTFYCTTSRRIEVQDITDAEADAIAPVIKPAPEGDPERLHIIYGFEDDGEVNITTLDEDGELREHTVPASRLRRPV